MFREPEGGQIFDMDRLVAVQTDYDEVKTNIQKGYGAKDTYGPLSSVNPPISVAAPKPLLSDMDSISFLPTKIHSFA